MRDSIGATAGMLLSNVCSGWSVSGGGSNGSSPRPNIILVLADDMGFSDIGCYGSEIQTPILDHLAAGGLRFTQFYNNPRCCPSRASLMTGLYPHQVGFGLMADDYSRFSFPAYSGDLSNRCATIAEVLRSGDYHTMMCGKWHLTPPKLDSKQNWPLQRGFERFFGTIAGAGSYFDPSTLTQDNTRVRAKGDFYYTDAIAENASAYVDEFGSKKDPFFLYVAFTSPHWPLHALEEDIAKCQDRYGAGWDKLRLERHQRMLEMGLVEKKWGLSPRDTRVPPWKLAPYKDWEARRMAVYAAQIERMDKGIGKILAKVQQLGIENNTLIMFMSDNGGNYEELPNLPALFASVFFPHETRDGRLVRLGNVPSVSPGDEDTYQSYGIPWGNLSNTPFKYYKHYTHEGGISTPLIAYWPAGIQQRGGLTHQMGHEMDIMATCIDVARVEYPKTYQGNEIIPLEGKSLFPIFQGKQREDHKILCWEHEGNSAIREGRWKLVSKYPNYWELHDIEEDRTEMHDLADKYPERVKEMATRYAEWAKRVGVQTWPLPGMRLDAEDVPPYLKR